MHISNNSLFNNSMFFMKGLIKIGFSYIIKIKNILSELSFRNNIVKKTNEYNKRFYNF